MATASAAAPVTPGDDPTVEWLSADLGHSSDLTSAVEGVDAVIPRRDALLPATVRRA